MDWRISLDKYLTQEPQDYYDEWCLVVVEGFSEEFFNKYEDEILNKTTIIDKWLNSLYDKGCSCYNASAIIERAVKLYVK